MNELLGLVTVKVYDFAVLVMRTTTVVWIVVQLTSAMNWGWLQGAIWNWRNAMTGTIFRALADLACVCVRENAILVSLLPNPLTVLLLAHGFAVDVITLRAFLTSWPMVHYARSEPGVCR